MFKVILVDDEMFTRKGLMKLIDWEACGFQVVEEADNGEDALEVIRRIQPELVVTDIRMPVLDGLELIRRVTEGRVANPVFIILSGYDDFNYAQRAVRYGVHDFILKPIDELHFTETLQGLSYKLTRDRADNSLKNNLLTGAMIETLILDNPDDAFLAEWEERLMLKQENGLYYMFAEMNDVHLSCKGETSLSLSKFKEILQRNLQRVTGGEQPFYLHEHRNRIGFIVPDSTLQPFQGEIMTFAESLLQQLKSECDCRIFLYAGSKVGCLADIRDSYRSAKEALQYKYVHDDMGIVIHDGRPMQALQYISLDDKLYSQLAEQIEEMASEKLKNTIGQIFATFRDKRYAPEAVKMNIHQCVTIIVKIIHEMDGNEHEISTLGMLLDWHDLNLSLSELRSIFTSFAEESGRYIADLRKKQQSGDIQKIRSHIEAHYQEMISLKSIAALFYINPVYLGQLFKKTYGLYFNDFLQQLRINEAKRLLRQTDLWIYEVAERVGYNNRDYFVTKFERLEGTTPSEYRNGLTKSERTDT
ncbi:MAG: response regulator transcription factor [Gorillibacterium sp.]|nr:response regulator transcription factor [Gorillibacterium sp.]